MMRKLLATLTIGAAGLGLLGAAPTGASPTGRQATPIHCTRALRITSSRHHNVTYLYRRSGTCEIRILSP